MTADSEAGMGTASGPWSARVYHLGEEPIEDLSAVTTAEQRLGMVWELTARMWTLTGRPLPSYARGDIPVVVVRGR
jgi:hypothetical protein